MLGRKALAKKKGGQQEKKKKKWQESDSEEEVDLEALANELKTKEQNKPARLVDSDDEGEDMQCSDDDANPGRKKKREKEFAWMDSDSETGEGGDDKNNEESDDDEYAPRDYQVEGDSSFSRRPLTVELIAITGKINNATSLDELWHVIDYDLESFSAYHIVAAFRRVVVLKSRPIMNAKMAKLMDFERAKEFQRLRDRAFDFIEDSIGRSTFLPSELASFCESFVALDVPTDQKIFQHVTYEAISRIKQFPPTTLVSLVYALSFQRFDAMAMLMDQIVGWATPKLGHTLTFEDVAKLLAAYTLQKYKKQPAFIKACMNSLKPKVILLPEAITPNMKTVSTMNLVDVISAMSFFDTYDKQLCADVCKRIQIKLFEVNPFNLHKLLSCMETLKHDPEGDFVRAVKKAIQARADNQNTRKLVLETSKQAPQKFTRYY